MNDICGVYKILCITSNKFYIGSSDNIFRRFKNHKNDLNKNKHSNSYLQNAWNKYRENQFQFTIVEIVISPNDLLKKEQEYLDNLMLWKRKIGYNISKFADSPNRGRKMSKNSRKKMSIAQKIRASKFPNGMLGRKHSEFTKRKWSEIRKGRRLSDIHKQKITTFMQSNKHPCRGKGLFTEKQKTANKKLAESRKKYIKLISPEGKLVTHLGRNDFCKTYKINRGLLHKLMKKEISHTKGWTVPE